MAPTLRSSAQNSPASMTAAASVTPSSSPRKAPHCSQCGRPRTGHPRSGCPYADSETPTKRRISLGQGDNQAGSGGISRAFSTLDISTPEDDKAFARERRRSSRASALRRTESLVSLSASSADIIKTLLQPESGERPTKVVHWADSVLFNGSSAASSIQDIEEETKVPIVRGRILMPCTLIPPTPESSVDSIVQPSTVQKQEIGSPVLDSRSTQSLSDDEDGPTTSSPPFKGPNALSRTMSDMERNTFVSRLSQDAPASVYIIPQADAEQIVAQATALKFHVYVSMQEGGEDENALLILGRNEKAVQDIVATIRKNDSKVTPKPRTSYGTLVTGVAAGAALMFGGLASI